MSEPRKACKGMGIVYFNMDKKKAHFGLCPVCNGTGVKGAENETIDRR